MNTSIRVCLITMALVSIFASVGFCADESPVYDIPKIDGITIDGKADDWSDRGFQVNLPTDGKGAVKKSGDFAPRFRLAWNDQGLLVLVVVSDDKAVEDQRGLGTWMDSVQVILSKGRGSPDLIRAVIIPGLDQRQPGMRAGFVDPGKSGPALARDESEKLAKLKIEAAETHAKGSYTVEAMIPWSNLGIKPVEGLELAANMAATDADVDDPDIRPFGAGWYPSSGLIYKVDRAALHRIRLAKSPSASQDVAVRVFCPGRTLSVNVTAAKELAGKEVVLKRGGDVIAKSKLVAGESCSTASLTASVSAFEGTIVASAEVEGGPRGTAILDSSDAPGCLANHILTSDDCRTWDMQRLHAAAQALGGVSAREAQARAKLIEHVEKAYFADPARLRHGELGGMETLIRNVQNDLDAKRIERWTAAIRSVLEMKENVDPDNVPYLILALAMLTDTDAAQCATDWLAKHGQSADDECLLELGLRSRSFGPEGNKVRAEIAKRVEGFIIAHKALTDVDICRVNAAITVLGDVMSPEQKQSISGKLAALRPLDEKHLGDLEAWPYRQLLDAYVTLEARDSVAAMLGGQAYAKFPLPDQAMFLQAANRLEGFEAATIGISRLQEQFPSLLSEKKFGEATLTASRMSAMLTPETKAQWAGNIRKAFLADAKAITALNDDDFTTAARCLADLSDAEGLGFMLKDERIAKDYSPQQMQSTLGLLWRFDKESRDSLEEIVRGQFETAYLAGNRLEGQDVSAVMALCRRMADGLPADRRDAWLKQLRSKLIRDGALVKELAAEDIPSVTGLLAFMGDQEAPALAGQWIEKNWGQVSLGMATSLFSSTPLPNRSPEKAQLARHVQRCLLDDSKMSGVTAQKAAMAVSQAADSLDADNKAPLAAAMMARYAPDNESAAALRLAELQSMFNAVTGLGGVEHATMLLENNASWREGGMSDFAGLCASARRLGKEGEAIGLTICDQFEKRCLAQPLRPQELGELAKALDALFRQLPPERLESLTRKVEPLYGRKEFLESLDAQQVATAVKTAVILNSVEGARAVLVGNERWPSLPLRQMVYLSNDLNRLGKPGQPVRELFASRADAALDGAKSAADLAPADRLVAAIAGDMPAERKQVVAGKVATLYPLEDNHLGALSAAEYQQLLDIHIKLAAKDNVAAMAKNQACRQFSPLEQATILKAATPLAGAEAGANLKSSVEKQLASLIAESRLSDALAVANTLSSVQTQQESDKCWRAVHDAFMSGAKTIAALNEDEYQSALRQLAQREDVECLELLFKDHRVRDSYSPAQMQRLLSTIGRLGNKAAPLYLILCEHLDAGCSAGRFDHGEMPVVLAMARQLTGRLPVEKMSELANRLMKTYVPDEKAAASLPVEQWRPLFDTVAVLGDIDAARTLLQGNESWRKGTLAELAGVHGSSRHLGRGAAELQTLVSNQFEKTYLAAERLEPKELNEVARAIDAMWRQFPAQRQTAMARKLEHLYGDKEFIVSLDPQQAASALHAAVVVKSVEAAGNVLSGNQNWPSLNLSQMVALAGDLARLGKDAAPLREIFASRADAVLEGAKVAADLANAANLVAAIADATPAHRKVSLAARMAELHPLDDEHLGALSAAEFRQLLDIHLELAAKDNVSAMVKNAACKKFTAQEQAVILAAASPLIGDQAGAALAAGVDKQLAALLADRKLIEAMAVANTLSAAQTQQEKDNCWKAVRNAFLAGAKEIAAFSDADFQTAMNELVQRQDDQCLGLLLNDARLSDSYSLAQMQRLLPAVNKMGDKAGPLYSVISGQMEKACASGRFKADDMDGLLMLARQLAGRLSVEDKTRMADALVKLYVPNAKAASAMAMAQLRPMLDTVSILGSLDAAKMLLDSNQSWREGTISDLTAALNSARCFGRSAGELEAMIRDQFEKTYVSGDGLERDDIKAVTALGCRFVGGLPAERKTAWREQLGARLIKDGAFAPMLKAKDILQAADLLISLGDSDAATVTSAWLDKNWTEASLATVSALLSSAPSPNTSPAKREMARHVLRCLLDEAKMGAVKSVEAARAAGPLADIIEADKQRELADALMKRYSPDAKSAAVLTGGELSSMFHAVIRLGGAAGAELLLKGNDSWRSAKMNDLASMYASAIRLGDEGLVVSTMIREQFEKAYMSQPPEPKDIGELAMALDGMARQMPSERMEVMAGKLEKLYGDKAFVAGLDAPQAVAAVKAAVAIRSVEAARAVLAGNANWPKLALAPTVQLAGDLAKLGEVGAPLQELFAARAEAALDTIKHPSQLPDAVKLVNAVADAMTPERQQALAASLMMRLAKDDKASDALSSGDLIDLATVLGRLGAIEEARGLLSQRRLAKLDMLALGRLAAAYGTLQDKGAPVRVALVDHVERTWILSGKLQQADLPQLSGLLGRLFQDFTLERRTAWAKALRTAMASDATLGAMDIDAFTALDDILRRLGDTAAQQMFDRWMAAETWKSGDAGKLLTLVGRRTYVGQENDSAALKKITDHILKEYLTGVDSASRIAPAAWRAGAARLSGFMTEDQRRLAGRRILTAFAGDMDSFAGLRAPDVAALTQCWRTLGRQDIAALVSEAQRVVGGNAERLRDRANAETVCGLVLTQMTAADAKDRKRVWEIGRNYIADGIDQFSERTFEIIDSFVEAMESDPALAEAIITDLARRTADAHDTLPKLERRFAGFALARRIGEAPAAIQESFKQTQKLQAAGKLPEATAGYRAIADGKDCPEAVRDGLNRRIVALLLEQQTDIAALDKYLPALRRQGEGLDAEAWNLTCRALLRRVAATKEGRATAWKNGLADLGDTGGMVVRERTFEDLDKLTAFLVKEGDGELAATIMADLLLSAPDRYSMRRLQWRRIAAFTEAKDWDSARAAAAMDVVLAAASCQGVTPPLERYMEILRSSGMAEAKVAEEAGNLLCGVADGGAATGLAIAIDEPLKRAAQEVLKNAPATDNSRRVAYLHLLAGSADKALAAARDRLSKSAGPREAADALADVYVFLAAGDGGLARANRFADWVCRPSLRKLAAADDKLLAILATGDSGQAATAPADDAKTAAARAFLLQWTSEMNLSAAMAASHGDKGTAERMYALALRASASPEDIAAVVVSIIQSQKAQMELADVRAALKEISALVPRLPHRRIVLVKMASLAHEEKLFDECLSILDDADALDAKAKEKDFAATMLRASSMLELEDYDGADKLLAEAAKWDGADDNKAQCLFVTACLRLKQGQMKDAREILQKLTDQYPRAAVAAKARQLAARVK